MALSLIYKVEPTSSIGLGPYLIESYRNRNCLFFKLRCILVTQCVESKPIRHIESDVAGSILTLSEA